MSLAAFQAQVTDLVRDKDQVVSSGSIDQAITAAVMRYSVDRPRTVLVDQAADGGVELALPAGWQEAFSRLVSLEYPVDLSPPSEIDLGEVRTRYKPDAVVLRLPFEIPAGALVRIGYTQQHIVDAGQDTVPDPHRYAVACLAGSIVCGQLHSYYATEGTPTIGADVSDHQGKSERWRTRARDLSNEYLNALGLNVKRSSAAAQVTSMRGSDSQGNARLFHDRRYRR